MDVCIYDIFWNWKSSIIMVSNSDTGDNSDFAKLMELDIIMKSDG